MSFLDYFPKFIAEWISPTPPPAFDCISINDWQNLWDSNNLSSTNITKLSDTIYQCGSELKNHVGEVYGNKLPALALLGLTTAAALYYNRQRIFNRAETFRDHLQKHAVKYAFTFGGVLARYLLSRDPENESLKSTIKLLKDNWDFFLLITNGISILTGPLQSTAKESNYGPVSGKNGDDIIGKLKFGFEGSDKKASPEALLAKTTNYMRMYADVFKKETTSQEDKDKIANGLQDYLVKNTAPILSNQFSGSKLK
jgi:hypothetical protein